MEDENKDLTGSALSIIEACFRGVREETERGW